MCISTDDVQIGFKQELYTVNEGKGNVVVEVELKHGFTTEVEIPFTITVTAGSAHSEFFNIVHFYLCHNVQVSPLLQILQTSLKRN